MVNSIPLEFLKTQFEENIHLASHQEVLMEENGVKLFYCAKCKKVHENVDEKLGVLTPEYLVDIMEMVEDGTINKLTADKLIKWYVTCDEEIFKCAPT